MASYPEMESELVVERLVQSSAAEDEPKRDGGYEVKPGLAVSFGFAFLLGTAAYASVGGFRSNKSLVEEQVNNKLELARIEMPTTFDDCGQYAYCSANPTTGMTSAFCVNITGKNCPCTLCCNLFPLMAGCDAEARAGHVSTIIGPNRAAGLMRGPSGGIKISCFPGEAHVRVRGRAEPMAIAALRTGDHVLAEHGYEEVLSFLHKVPEAQGTYVSVEHDLGEFRASPKHVVFVRDGGGSGRADKYAEELAPGDALMVAPDGSPSRVLSVRRVGGGSGWYAPFTASGTVVVDGVVASTYANVRAHSAAHAAFFLARVYYRAVALVGLGGVEDVAAAEVMHPLAAALKPLEVLLPGSK